MKKILVTYNMFREVFVELEQNYEVTFPTSKDHMSYDEVSAVIGQYDVLCCMFSLKVDKALIDRGTRLQLIANYGVGYDNIDVAYAQHQHIAVANTPDPVTEPTADLALALLLDVARRVSECDRLMRAGVSEHWNVLSRMGVGFSGKTLGIFGMGRIGQALCRRATACGLRVIYHNRYHLPTEKEAELHATYVTLDELFLRSDFLSLNAPHTPETYHTINADSIAKMRPNAVIINTARGALIDEKALAQALKEKRILGAGLDVFENKDRPIQELLTLDNVVMTPHIGTQTTDDRLAIARTVCNNVLGFFEKNRPVSLV